MRTPVGIVGELEIGRKPRKQAETADRCLADRRPLQMGVPVGPPTHATISIVCPTCKTAITQKADGQCGYCRRYFCEGCYVEHRVRSQNGLYLTCPQADDAKEEVVAVSKLWLMLTISLLDAATGRICECLGTNGEAVARPLERAAADIEGLLAERSQ